MRLSITLALALAATAHAQPVLSGGQPAAASSGQSAFFLEQATPAGSLSYPTGMAFAPDGSAYVIEKGGGVRLMRPDGSVQAEPVLSLAGEVYTDGDRGLIGVTLHPAFPATPYLYLFYSVDDVPLPRPASAFRGYSRLLRVTVADGGGAIVPGSRRVLLGQTAADGVPSCYNSHGAGALAFGHDGALYVGHGDGASWAEPDAGGLYPECFDGTGISPSQDLGAFRSQTAGSLSGKILRLDPETGQGLPDNPFWTGDPDDIASRVWAMGLRNPFRFAVAPQDPDNPGQTELLIGDVGDGLYEELNRARGGENFGWPCFEGPSLHRDYPPYSTSTGLGCSGDFEGTLTAPWAYFHHYHLDASAPAGIAATSITGGGFYPGESYPERYRGMLFFADFSEGWISAGRLGDAGMEVPERIVDAVTIVDLAYDPSQDVMAALDLYQGRILHLRHSGDGDPPPVARAVSTEPVGERDHVVTFSDAGSYDPAGGELTYRWSFGTGDGADGPEVTYAYYRTGSFLATLTVTNAQGQTGQTILPITVGESLPRVEILSPTGYTVGPSGVAELSMTATDSRGETLDTFWELDLVHNAHTHPGFSRLDAASGSVQLVPHAGPGEVAYYRARAVAIDEEGLRVEASRTLRGYDAAEFDVAMHTAEGGAVMFSRPVAVGAAVVPAEAWSQEARVEVQVDGLWAEPRSVHALEEGAEVRVLFASEPVTGVRLLGADTDAQLLTLRLEPDADLGPWEPADAGASGIGRTVSADGGLMMVGTGTFADGTYHVARAVVPDGASLVTRIAALDGGPDARAGLVVVTGFGADARGAGIGVDPMGGVQSWTVSGGRLIETEMDALGAPAAWLRITRQDGVLRTAVSADSVDWQSGASYAVGGDAALTGGPAVAGGDRAALAWFESPRIVEASPKPPQTGIVRVQGVYPNPGSGTGWLTVEAGMPGTYTADVVDALGRVVLRMPAQTAAEPERLRFTMERRQLAQGVYAIRLLHLESGTVRLASFTVVR